LKNPFIKGGFFLALWLAVAAASGQGTWEKVDVPVSPTLRSVWFTDSLFGWIAGDSGTMLHTQDGGVNWQVQETQTACDIMEVFFLDRERGWASAFNFTNPPLGTVLLRTADGGATWNSIPYPAQEIFMNCILFLDSLHGWMGGSPHALVKTTDGGDTWSQARIDTATLSFFPVLNIKFFGDTHGYACGGMFDIAGVIWRTHDGGEMWYPIDVAYAPADEVRQLHCFDSVTIMGAGGDPDLGYGVAMMRSFDGGISWDYEELGMPGNAYDLDFRTSYEAWAPLGPRRKFIYSLDTGQTWTEIPTPHSALISDVIFPDSLHGYAVGDKGFILKYKPPFPVSVDEGIHPAGRPGLEIAASPNPFSVKTIIRVIREGSEKSRGPDEFILKVYDLRGNEVARQSGIMTGTPGCGVVFDASGLSGGVYCCQVGLVSVRGELITATEKLVILP
jgi:photosystem II stability/assembly factor-like uncharacterized protein